MPKLSCAVPFISFEQTIVEKLCEVVCEYEMPFMPRSSYGRPMWEDSGQNRDFLTYLFCVQGFTIQFLKDVGVLRSKVQRNTRGRDMTWSAEPSIPEGFRW